MKDVEMMNLTVGPVQYYWPRQRLQHFYAMVADSPASTVVLGEVVCSRRHEMKPEDWLALARELNQAGKEVVLTSLALIETEAELRGVRRGLESEEFMHEANDLAAVRQLARSGRPWVIGPHLNVYSAPALAEFQALGARRWVPGVELDLEAIARVAKPHAASVDTEVFAFGRMPLALSARCFTARHHGLRKDVCEFRCDADADGLTLKTREGEVFLALNGIQTQSGAVQCLIDQGPALARAGVRRLRLSPCAEGFDHVLALFDGVMNHGHPARDALSALRNLPLPGPLANGYVHARQPGMTWITA